MINLGCNTTLSVFAGVIVAVITTKLLNIPWSEVEQNIIKTAAECMPTFLIVIMVGMLVGTIYICTIELISKNFNFKKINTMNNRQEIERVSRSCRF